MIRACTCFPSNNAGTVVQDQAQAPSTNTQAESSNENADFETQLEKRWIESLVIRLLKRQRFGDSVFIDGVVVVVVRAQSFAEEEWHFVRRVCGPRRRRWSRSCCFGGRQMVEELGEVKGGVWIGGIVLCL
ncbi:hypothetical protein RHMOL_Rhmol06G0109500 [Rhododendron molle]|uniref:Uncharacterized protein n=1 Tax=Rhododendron molle TaxID=49168 RepID=A0ACC0NB15_RHOML|nr:hypothetical protein RHMOL_Rhmol06G0109500 [Rhododendron molle]